MTYEFASTLEKIKSAVWNICLMVPLDVSEQVLKNKHTRFNAVINNNIKIPVALMPHGNGQYFININKEIRSQLGVAIGDELEVKLTPDESKYGMPLPPEFEELLNQDEEGSHFFHALTPGKQRNLIYIVSKYKNSDTRIKKSIVILNYLKSTNGKLDFKELNEAFKHNK